MEGISAAAHHAPFFTVPGREIVAVEHPMVIKNVDNGLKTFGTDPQFKYILTPDDYEACLPIYLRPHDPTCAPILSHNAATTNVVMKITAPKRTGRKRKRGSNAPYVFEKEHVTSSQDARKEKDGVSDLRSHSRLDTPAHLRRILEDNVGTYQVEAVGTIIQTHRFRGLADFHYSTVNSKFMNRVRDTLLTGDLEKIKDFKFDPEKGYKANEDLIPPPAMTHHPFPFNWGYHQNSSIKIKTNLAGEKVLVNQSDPLKVHTLYISHTIDEVPTAPPHPGPIGEPKLQKLIDDMRRALEERPIWTRRALLNRLAQPDTMHLLKKTIHYVGYQFRGGPWRDAVIRYGVDPRKDPKYRIYQTLFFKIFDESERTQGKRFLAHRHEHAKSAGMNPTSHFFDGKTIYLDGKIWQICDITDPVCLKILTNGTITDKCDINDNGWYGNGTYAKLKAVMRTKISAIMIGREMADSEFDEVLRFPDVVSKKKTVFVPVPNFNGAQKRRPHRDREGTHGASAGRRTRSPSKGANGEATHRSDDKADPSRSSWDGLIDRLETQPASGHIPVDSRVQETMAALDEQGGLDNIVAERFGHGNDVANVGKVDDVGKEEEVPDDEDDAGHDDVDDVRDEDEDLGTDDYGDVDMIDATRLSQST
ncbi:MAG: tau 95 subunit of transcription factor TFIIIC [Claussenomyces sp. TS43310]|nr:MAG: tau 95 subunit of transcription factor TFIIIC [Claussenomyces sp. TS43310]